MSFSSGILPPSDEIIKMFEEMNKAAKLGPYIPHPAQQAASNAFSGQNFRNIPPNISNPPPSPPPTGSQLNRQALALLYTRLKGFDTVEPIKKDDYLYCHVHGDKVFIFFLFNGMPGHTQEEKAIFPSDTLIAQLRMIK